ncbi:MAG TPA: VCBS repeat-containing protein, partial [Motilibacteraceae bacterium]|nr:VCBS repeat-containing protein [Motilibacteraceae bacterium]
FREPTWDPASVQLVATGTSSTTGTSALYGASSWGDGFSEVAGSTGLAHPSWGDQWWVVAQDDSRADAPLVRIEMTDGTRQVLPGTAGGRLPAVDPGAGQVAFLGPAAAGGAPVLRLADLGTGTVRTLPMPAGQLGTPSWSRDGAWVLAPVTVADGSTTTVDVWRVRRDGSGLSQLPHTAEDETSVADAGVDALAPQVVISPASGYITGDEPVTFQASDTGTRPSGLVVTCSIDGQQTGFRCTSPVSPGQLAEGPHLFSVTAQDSAGNVTTQEVHWQVDRSAPLVYPPDLTPEAGGLRVSFGGGDQWGKLESADLRERVGTLAGGFSGYVGVATGTTATSVLIPAAADHTYCLSVRGHDTLGHVSAWSAETCHAMGTPPTHELNGPGANAVLVSRDRSGNLGFTTYLGATLSSGTTTVGRSWQGMTSVLLPGDVDGDGVDDLVTRDGLGRLWLYPRNGRLDSAGWKARRQIGSGWQGFTALVAAPDLTGDRHPDLLARDGAGRLWLYPMNGKGGWLPRRLVGSGGWQAFTALAAPGDFDGDGHADLLARDVKGALWLYPGDGRGGWLARRQVGSGWGGFTALLTTGDFDSDGHPDVVGRTSDGRLWLYPGNGRGGWHSRVLLASGWGSRTLIA